MQNLQYAEASMINQELPKASLDRSHHVWSNGKPAYAERFDEVLSFHPTKNGVFAAVSKGQKAWHIDIHGDRLYPLQFDRTFGFYCEYAAVVDSQNWFHIGHTGERIYPENYVFAGNYQENMCAVCDQQGQYFHIDRQGMPLYKHHWIYCGDYREGIAVVQSSNGLSTHINKTGMPIHSHWFDDLDIFHKGFARAKDTKGWFHIDLEGNPIYPQRYASIEPFYNGCSRVESEDGSRRIINESGKTIRIIRPATADRFAELSEDMVGYWKTFAISTFVEIGLPDLLPASISSVAMHTSISEIMVERILKAMHELDITIEHKEHWHLTEKGQYLSSTHEKTLAPAALEYSDELLMPWKRLPDLIRGCTDASSLFKDVASNADRCKTHHQMLSSYAIHDYGNTASLFNILENQTVFDAGGGLGFFSTYLQTQFPEATIVLGDLAEVVALSTHTNKLAFDLFSDWPISANHVLVARVLHDWADDDAIAILKNAAKALTENGRIHVIEMLLNDGDSSGSLCDLHLLASTGGQERTLEQLEKLAKYAGLKVLEVKNSKGLVSLVEMVPKNA